MADRWSTCSPRSGLCLCTFRLTFTPVQRPVRLLDKVIQSRWIVHLLRLALVYMWYHRRVESRHVAESRFGLLVAFADQGVVFQVSSGCWARRLTISSPSIRSSLLAPPRSEVRWQFGLEGCARLCLLGACARRGALAVIGSCHRYHPLHTYILTYTLSRPVYDFFTI